MGILGTILLCIVLFPVAVFLLILLLKFVGIGLLIGGIGLIIGGQWIPGLIMLIVGGLIMRIGGGDDDGIDLSDYW